MVQHVSNIDRDPSFGIMFKRFAILSVVSFVTHIFLYDSSYPESFGKAASPSGWLACKIPLWFTGFSNFVLLLWTNFSYDELFSNREEPYCEALEDRKVRTSGDPAQEERLHSQIQTVAFAAGLTFSSDILITWYNLVETVWLDSKSKSQTNDDEWVVFLFTVVAVMLLFCTWIPSYNLRSFGMCARSDKKLLKGRERMKAIVEEASRIKAQEGIEKWWSTLDRVVSIMELGSKYAFEEYENERAAWRKKREFDCYTVNMTGFVDKSVKKARDSTAMLEELLRKVNKDRSHFKN